MGFFSEILSATVKTVLTPVVVVKDIVTGDVEDIANHIKDIIDDVGNAVDDLTEGDL